MNKTDEKWILAGISFTILFLACIYQLTNAPLWYDETVEYYCSKTMVGLTPGFRSLGISTMYERIVSTYQPPLYNFVMFFWLKISESEWWFRFFGVVMGIIGAAGVYKSVEKVWNHRAAAISVIVLSCTRNYIYYVQECGEYNLMLAGLCWLMYLWICLMEKVTPKRILGFLLAATVSVYSQYGAVFPVVAFSVTALIYVLRKKDKNEIRQMLFGYGTAAIIAALPLWLFFMSKQMQNQQSSTTHSFTLVNGFLWDMCNAVKEVVNWCFPESKLRVLAIAILLFCCCVVIVFSKQRLMKYLVMANMMCWIMYYAAVKFSFYNYGIFGRRYSLFFLPLWMVSLFMILFESKEIAVRILKKYEKNKYCKTIIERRMMFGGIGLAISFAFCLTGWDVIKPNWSKEDIRGVVEAWYDTEGYNVPTLIYYVADSGFSYYCEHNEKYDGSKLDNVVFMHWYQDKSAEEYTDYLNELFKGVWPDHLYLVGSHMQDDFYTIVQCFTSSGYTACVIYDGNDGYGNNARLIYLTRTNT